MIQLEQDILFFFHLLFLFNMLIFLMWFRHLQLDQQHNCSIVLIKQDSRAATYVRIEYIRRASSAAILV